MEETLSFLKEGESNIVVSDSNNVVLLLGNTGSGKSTLTQFIAGDNSKLNSQEVNENSAEYVITDNNLVPRIGIGIESHTVLPEFVLHSTTNTAYYDCPGFNDTRNVSLDIGCTYFIKKIIDKAEFVKLVFVISHPSVQVGVNRSDFRLLLNHAVHLINDIDKFRDGIALVVTKVNNQYIRKGREITLVSDEATINNIAKFLEDARNSFNQNEDLQEHELFIIRLINIFLAKENGKYTKIGIFRRPEESGCVSGIELLQDAKVNLCCLLENNITFIPKEEQDFGYTISAESRNIISSLVDKINQEINMIIASIGEKIQKYFLKIVDSTHDFYQLQSYLDDGYERYSKMIGEITEEDTSNTLFKKILSFTNYLKIDVSDECLQDIRNQSNYLSFLQTVSNQTFQPRHLEWIQLMNTTLVKLKGLSLWNKLLLDLYSWLSEYSIQKDTTKYNVAYIEDWGLPEKERGIFIHSENLEQFLKKLNRYDADIMQQFNEDTDLKKEEKLRIINHLLTITLKNDVELSLTPEADRLVIRGSYVKFSEVFHPKIDDRIKQIEIFSTNTVFIDADFVSIGSKIQLSIIAPKWVVEGSRSIVLDGIPGAAHPEARAADAYYIKHEVASYGEQGKPGLPGGCGGNFLGIAQEIIGDSLKITANGGDGGIGQVGGNGASGYRGEDGQIPDGDDGLTNITNTYQELNSGRNDYQSWKMNYIIYGTSGGIGSNGNDGGKGGIGGNPGSVMLFASNERAQITISTNKGSNGEGGKGGKRGVGGENGFTVSAELVETITPTGPSFSWNLNYKVSMGRAPFGKCGASNINVTGIKSPEAAVKFQQPSYIINKCRSYFRQNITDRFKSKLLNQFDDQLNNDPDVRSTYDTLGLVNELQELENQNYDLREVDFIPYYQSLLSKVSLYAEAPKANEKTPQYRKVLSFLYTAVQSKICKLKSAQEPSLIIDISLYLKAAIININTVKDKLENFTKHCTKQNYLDEINYKIKEANDVIGKIVLETDSFLNQMDRQIDISLNDVIELRSNSEARQQQLRRKQEQLKSKLVIKKVLNVITTVGYVAHYAIPVFGGVINAGVRVTTMVSSQFLLSDKPKEKVSEKKTAFEETNYNFQNVKNKKNLQNEVDAIVAHYLNLIKSFSAKINSHATVLKDEIRVNEIVAQLNALCNEKEFQMPKIKSLTNELMNELKLTNFKGKTENEHMDDDTKKLFIEVDRFCKTSSISNVSVTMYNEHLNQEANLTEVSNAIKQSQEEMNTLEKYENNLFTRIIPKLNSLREDFDNLPNNLESKSEVALKMIKEELRDILQGMKLQLKQFDKQFEVHEKLCRCIDKLDEALNSLINVYTQIQKYYDDKMLADYIANMSSPSSFEIGLDDELQAALVQLEFVIQSNIVLAQYDKALCGFKQWVFPFADYYLRDFEVLSLHNGNRDLKELVESAANQIESLRKNIIEYNSTIRIHDEYVHLSEFNSNFESSEPFFVWKNENNGDMITRLLNGEEIILNANIWQRSSNKNAIKFDLIELNFKSKNNEIQEQLNFKLKNLQVEMTHLGNSYYKCGRKVYMIKSDSQTIRYSYEKRDNGCPVSYNTIYDKIIRGDLMLSPYALWRLKLEDCRNGSSRIAVLPLGQDYGNSVDLELVGHGQFIHERVDIDNLKLDKYYNDECLDKINSS